MILCLIFSAASVSAAEINNTDQELSTSSNIDTLCANVEEDTINNTNTLGVSEDTVLTAGVNDSGSILKANEATGSYSDLANLIRLSSGTLTLYQDYKYDSARDSQYKDGINIDKAITIDGNNHKITLSNSNTLFIINSNNVILKNLNLLGQSGSNSLIWYGDNGIINNTYFESTNRISWFGACGLINYSTFKNYKVNILEVSSNQLTISNSNFIDHSTSDRVINTQPSASQTHIINCNFTNCAGTTTTFTGGILSFYGSWMISGCRFIDCGKNTQKIIWAAFPNGIIDKCYIQNQLSTYFYGAEAPGILINNTVFNKANNALALRDTDNGAYSLDSGAVINNCTFMNTQSKVAVLYGNGVSFTNCKFINNDNKQFLIDLYNSYYNRIINCTFENNTMTTKNQGLIYGSGYFTEISNCTFKNTKYVDNSAGDIYISAAKYNFNIDAITNQTARIIHNNFEVVPFTLYDSLWVSSDSVAGQGNGSYNNPLTFSEARNLVSYGGTIFMKNGNYATGQVPIGQRISYNVVGEEYGKVIINTGTFEMFIPNIKIQNLTFQSCGYNTYKIGKTTYYYCFITYHGCDVRDCIFLNVNRGVDLFNIRFYAKNSQFHNILCKDCTFYDFLERHVSSKDYYDAFIWDNITIDNCKFNYLMNSMERVPYASITNINITNNCVFNSMFRSIEDSMYVGSTFENLTIESSTFDYAIYLNNKNTVSSPYILNNVTIVDCISNQNNRIFNIGGNSVVSNLTVKNHKLKSGLSKTQYSVLYTYGDKTSVNNLTVVNSPFTYLVDTNYIDLENVNITNSSFNTLFSSNDILPNVINSYTLTNVSFSTNNIMTISKTGSVIKNSDFYNVSGHIIVDGKSVNILKSNFTNCSNSGLNGSVFYVKQGSDYFKVRDCLFLNNSAGYGGAIYIEPEVQRTGFYNTNFTNNTAKKIDTGSITDSVSDDNELHYNLSDYNTGGAIYFKENLINESTGVYSTHIVTHDAYTWSTINMTSFYFNNIHGNLTELVSDVYVVLHPEDWIHDGYKSNGNAKSWLNAGSLYNAFLVAGDDCVFHFVNSSEVHDFTNMNWIPADKNFPGDTMVPPGSDSDSMSDGLTFNGNNTSIAHLGFHILSNRSVNVYNLTFMGYPGSAVIVDGEGCIFENCSFINNGDETTVYGAGIQINANNTRLVNVTFNNNKASCISSLGGALYINASRVDVINCTFNANGAGSGSHIYVTPDNEYINLTGNNFTYGVAVSSGSHSGVVLNSGTMITLVDSIFENNTGLTALLVDGLFLYCSIVDNTFKNNTGADDAGAFYLKADVDLKVPMSIYNNNFIGNNASGLGGALFIDYSNTPESLIFENATFSGNNASSLGGGLYINCSDIKLDNFDFTGNNATRGGAVYVNASNIVFNVADFTGNNATLGGAAYLNANGTVFNNCTFKGNVANFTESYGSAIYVADNTTVTVNSCRFDKNYVYGENGTLSRADLSYDGILPSISKDTVWTSNPYQQYAHNRTAVTIYYKMVYVSLTERGQGYSNATATTMDKALKGILPDGIIIICDDEYTWNETTLKMLHDANLVNVTFQGLTSKTSIKRTTDQQNNKYLFNQPKNAKNKKKLCKNISFQLIIYPPI